MTLSDLKASIASANPPPDLPPGLTALWHDARGDWTRAHEVAQEIHDANGAWIHAYLHRREGDLGNAAYWYRRAGRPVETGALDAEWNTIADALLQR